MRVPVGVDETCTKQQRVVVQDLRRRAHRHNTATLENVTVVRDVLHQVEIMSGRDYRLAPTLQLTRKSIIWLSLLGSSAAVGSSSSRTSGSRISTEASATRFFSPSKMMRRTLLQV